MESSELSSPIRSNYLSKAELAGELEVSVRTIDRRALVPGGLPPRIRIGRLSLFRREAVIEWLRSLEGPRSSASNGFRQRPRRSRKTATEPLSPSSRL